MLTAELVCLCAAIEFSLFSQRFSHRLQGLTWLTSPLASHDCVEKIFPEFTVFPQVNQNGDFLARRVRNELDAFHHFPLPQFPSDNDQLGGRPRMTHELLDLPYIRGRDHSIYLESYLAGDLIDALAQLWRTIFRFEEFVKWRQSSP